MHSSASLAKARNPQFVFRELYEPEEVVALLRLRHRIYFENKGYGSPKSHGIDLTSVDHRSRLYGVFSGGDLVGGMRMVLRTEQPLALVMRAVRAVVQNAVPEECTSVLPSEEAFDLREVVGERSECVDVELSRFTLLPGISPVVSTQALVAVLAVVLVECHRLWVYSCSATIAPRYARFMSPTWTLTKPKSNVVASDGFVFPVPTVAAVGAVENSPFLTSVRRAADELTRTQQLVLPRSVPVPG